MHRLLRCATNGSRGQSLLVLARLIAVARESNESVDVGIPAAIDDVDHVAVLSKAPQVHGAPLTLTQIAAVVRDHEAVRVVEAPVDPFASGRKHLQDETGRHFDRAVSALRHGARDILKQGVRRRRSVDTSRWLCVVPRYRFARQSRASSSAGTGNAITHAQGCTSALEP